MNDLVVAAAEYLIAGLQVIALSGKAPNRAVHPRGLLNAMSGKPEDEKDDQAIRWAFEHPDTTGVGIVIRPPYFVLDVDGPTGAAHLIELLGDGWEDELAHRPGALTSRGLHIWFADTVERRSASLLELLDLKGPGGYVAAPPSLHPSGFVYTWIAPLVVDGQLRAPIELPDPLRDYLNRRAAIRSTPTYEGPRPIQRGYVLQGRTFVCVDLPATMDGLAHYLSSIRPGDRNNLLWWTAARAAEDGFSHADILATLGPVAAEIGLSEREIKTAVSSGYRRGVRRKV